MIRPLCVSRFPEDVQSIIGRGVYVVKRRDYRSPAEYFSQVGRRAQIPAPCVGLDVKHPRATI
jgi:hypothetical protein